MSGCLYLVRFFHLSAYFKWFVCLIRFLAVLFFCAFPGYVALSGFLGVHALSGWIGCFFYPKSFRLDIACACRFGW